jgi:hypothetical protein
MRRILCGVLVVVPLLLSNAKAQDTSQPISRQEFDELKKDNAQMKQDNAEMKKELADLKKQQTDQATNADQDEQYTQSSFQAVNAELAKDKPGTEGLVIAGDAAFGFTTQRKTESSFNADVSPLILWQPPDSHFLIETAFDLGIGQGNGPESDPAENQNSNFAVNLADVSYILCDNCMVGGGLFAVPFGQYHNHFDPPWINKFPDAPLAFGDDAIGPTSEVGFFTKGAIPSGTTRWTYDAYVANGPNLVTTDPATAGQLNFNDYGDLNNNKAVGGRIGFLPFPQLEMGYSIQASRVNPDGVGFPNTSALLQAVDFSYRPVIDALGGQFDLRGEWIWSHVGGATYDPTAALGFGPVAFTNDRNGGYVQLCYRPTKADSKIIQSIELVSRYDAITNPLGSPGGDHEQRWTMGVDYWVTPYIVLETAYEIDKKKVGPDQNAFLFEVGIGL